MKLTLGIGSWYQVEFLDVSKKSKDERIKKMEYLGEFNEILLFRHECGYKEAFMKKELGLSFEIIKDKKRRAS